MNDEESTAQSPSKRNRMPKGNLYGLVHGAYLRKLLSPEEFELFERTITEIHTTFELNDSSDAMVVIMCAYNFVRWQRALAAADDELQMKYRREVLILLEALKATREKREAATLEIKTPAEWAAEMMAKLRGGGNKTEPTGEERENDGAEVD